MKVVVLVLFAVGCGLSLAGHYIFGSLFSLLSVAFVAYHLWYGRQIAVLKAEILALFRDEPLNNWLDLTAIVRKIDGRRANDGRKGSTSIIAVIDALTELEKSNEVFRLLSGYAEKTRSRWHLAPPTGPKLA